ncbi:hypothetical protein [Agrococcus jejuensis]|uniref:Uncharacterized protein n=1 Tax=Agrococcus jejuensis TaxID=399736 RepID=A0A1G8GWH7_9MICO|nr:hypothetical protein [Agrococcus jejuensis]SDH98631.1 hypothetical protein SAMN04489720_3097 [Agrococcus jejuensis]
MTDYDGPPLTRRERKERERLLAETTGQTPAVDAPIADGAAVEAEPVESQVVEPEAVEPEQSATPVEATVVDEEPVDEAPAERAPEPDETQAIDVSELIADLKPQSTPAPDAAVAGVPAAGEARVQEAIGADAAAEEAPADVPAPSGFGRFFGRRGPAQEAQAEPAAEQSAPESIADVLADLQGDRDEAAAPSQPMQRIEVDDLDPVDDAEIDRLEIDEVDVPSARVSSRRIADSTPAELEDRRALLEDADDETDDEVEVQAGPSRATGRIPVIVNVVEDTSRHHIADLREDTSAISASSVGTGTSTITANALVLPLSGANEPITVETADGVIVTGSIDLPEGFASSGRSRGTIDTAEVDAVDDAGEVRSPETQPVRASRAVSSYANARVRIAPQRRSRNATPIVIGVAGGIGIVAVGATVVAFIAGWI